MRPDPQASPYRPDPQITAIAPWLGTGRPAGFPQHSCAGAMTPCRHHRPCRADDEAWIDHFGVSALEGNLPQPLALRYHGHQFRVYNPDWATGAASCLPRCAMARAADGPWHQGFGHHAMEPPGRWATDAERRGARNSGHHHARSLGANTSKTFSVVETGEHLHRGDEPSPTRSAVLVRLSHGHIRIGSFQRLMALEEDAHLAALVDYAWRNTRPGRPMARPTRATRRILLHQVERHGRYGASYVAAASSMACSTPTT
jgi:hypothetical protein